MTSPTSAETCRAIISAIDAWLLENVSNQEALYSATVNGRTFTNRTYSEMVSLRATYANELARLSGRRRTYGRFA